MFDCQQGETILDAGIKAGLILNYSCKTGRCGTCLMKVRQGDTKVLQEEIDLSPSMEQDGYIYSCCRTALSDVQIDAEDLTEYNIPSTQILPAKIDQIQFVHEHLVKISLRLPPGKNFTFLPGQYINVMHGAIQRSYSLANTLSENITLLIRKYAGGEMSRYWFEQAQSNDLLRIEGPLGTFFIRKSVSETLLLLATGTGIAPIKSILESGAHLANPYRRVVLIWGMRFSCDICWELPASLSSVEFIPVMSQDTDWKGAKGYVQDKAITMELDLASCDVYACGNANMIRSAKEKLISKGLPEVQFYADAFLPS